VELKQIKELMSAMERAGLKKLSIKEVDGFELQLERQCETSSHPPYPVMQSHPETGHARFSSSPPMPQRSHSEEMTKGEKKEEKPGKYLTSPMVGTFYASPTPDDPPFVKVGDRVEENTVVCIIEAMKVMNEVKAGVSGVIAEIYVENAHPVEFGTKILRIV
jgi:acetyl-CoA carboxylase biotin carboxyl carrier protein